MPPSTALAGLRSLADLPLERQRVLVRADLDVPLGPDSAVADERKLRTALPTLRYALQRGARVIVAGHLGSEQQPAPSLEPVAAKLAELLGQDVFLPDECVGDAARKLVGDLREGQLCLLENLTLEPGERTGDDTLARKLAALCDVFVHEALGCGLLRYASLIGVPRLINERGLGIAAQAELEALSQLAVGAARPCVGVVGGASLSDGLRVFEAMLARCDTICVAGGFGNTLLAARELDLKESCFERDRLAQARALMARARDRGVELLLPLDVVVAETASDSGGSVVLSSAVPDGRAALDIGPATLNAWATRLSSAQSAWLHGALGALENPAFRGGSEGVLRALAESPAFGVVTGSALTRLASGAGLELAQKIGCLSTGGMASLAVIEGKKLPGIEALRE